MPKTAFQMIACALLTGSVAIAPSAVGKGGPRHSIAKPAEHSTANAPWWQHALFYEVYLRSFGDFNRDGIGDLNGVTQHLDYLEDLGVDAIWLAPFYRSPQVDFGYDIADYRSVDPQYGSLADFDHLLAAAKKRGMRIVMDMVLNHTSDKSAWFIESASSRANSKADWYIWSDGIPATTPGLSDLQKADIRKGSSGDVVPPNNWVSAFGGSTWTWVPAREQFYYHKFYAEQPDLNWRNPSVEREMFTVMRFWLDRGVAGFRLDAIGALFELASLKDDPNAAKIIAPGYSFDLPEVHDVLKRLRKMTDSYPGHRVLIGELGEPTMAGLYQWYGGASHDQLHYPMDYSYGFPGVFTAAGSRGAAHLSADYYRRHLVEASSELGSSRPFIFFDNHDNPRSMDRFADGKYNPEIAKVLATLLLTVPAAAQMYYGQEIGMVTSTPIRREDVKDPVGRTGWPENKGRDGERTPMQWSAGPQAGFSSSANVWLPIPPSSATTNVATETAGPRSLLNWYKALIALRRNDPAMRDGGIVMVNPDDHNVLGFIRTARPGAKPILVVMNMTAQAQIYGWHLEAVGLKGGVPRQRLATPDTSVTANRRSVRLPPFGVWIATVD